MGFPAGNIRVSSSANADDPVSTEYSSAITGCLAFAGHDKQKLHTRQSRRWAHRFRANRYSKTAQGRNIMASRVVLLTGAAGGIGRVMTQALLADGHKVVAVDRDVASLERLKALCQSNARLHCLVAQ